MDGRFAEIPGSSAWTKIEPIKKGWSSDDKYYVEMDRGAASGAAGGQKLLVRISDITDRSRKELEFDALRALDGVPILMSRPIAFGTCNSGRSVFTVLTWIDGVPADEYLPALSPNEQYALGCAAGRTLKALHTIPAPEGQPSWGERFNRKIDRNIRTHASCEFSLPFADAIISYIDSNRHFLEGRPQVFQHGDYHCGNMIVTPEGELGIIDFNRVDYGDPWEEFNRIVWCAAVSGHFASGRINGYFDDEVPDEFFRLMGLYIGSNMLSSVPWAVPFGRSEVDTMIAQAREVMDWYDGYRQYVPRWYVTKRD